jgi:hypothetical protein
MMSRMIEGPPPEPPLPPRPGEGRRLAPWQWAALAIAALAVIVLVAIVVWPDSGDDDEVSVDTTAVAPSTTAAQVITVPSTAPPTTAATTTAPLSTTAPPTTAPPTTEPVFQLPTQAVAVTQDGRLVVLDTSSGQAVEVRELDRGPDPRVEVEEGTPAYLGAPSLTPDGATVYYHFCCEPVVGDLFRVPVDGSAEPERLGFGSDPTVNRQGDRLAYVAYDAIVVRDLASGAEASFPDPDHAGTMVDVTWTADGSALLYVRGGELVRLDLTNGQTQVVHTGQGYLAHPLDLGGTITVVDQCCYDDDTPFSLEQASLVTIGGGSESLPQPVFDRQLSAGGVEVRAYQDGTLVWFAEDRQASLGSGYSAADW